MNNPLNPLGFDNFSPGATEEQKAAFDKQNNEHFELCQAVLRTFNSDNGKKTLAWLRKLTVDNSTWCASLGMENAVPHGFAREGQNALFRHIEETMAEALRLSEQRKQLKQKEKDNGKS